MKNQDIERLRGIAILLVLFHHLSLTSVIFEKLNLNSKNMPFYLGVELFFLISGYVVSKSFLSKKLNLKLFYFKRIFRIFPLVIFFILFTFILNCFDHYFRVSWDIFISDALAILGAYLINSRKVYYNGAMWSLSVEMQFYIVFPVFLLMLSKINHFNNRKLIAIFSSLYVLIAVLLRYIIAYVGNIKLYDLFSYIASRKFDFFILGILVYFLELHILERGRRRNLEGNSIPRELKPLNKSSVGVLNPIPVWSPQETDNAALASQSASGSFTPGFIDKKVDIKKLGVSEKYISKNISLKILAFMLIALPCFISYKLGSCLSSYNDAPELKTIGAILFGICFFLLLGIASLDKNLLTIHPQIDKIIEYLGARSYSIYVLNFPIFVIVWMVINKFARFIFYIDPIYYGIAQLLLFIIIGIPIVEIVFSLIEKPGIRLGNLLIQKYKI